MQIAIRHRPVLIAAFTLLQIGIFYLGHLSGGGGEATTNGAIERRLPLQQAIETSIETSITRTKLATYLLIVVMSSPDRRDERKTVRKTWLRLSKESESTMRYVFVMGLKNLSDETRKQLNEEHAEYRDLMLIEHLVDAYENLARKTAYALKSAVNNYDFKFVLKTDTDSYIRVGHLIKAIRDIDHPLLYLGFLDGRAKPFRQGKWREMAYLVCDRYLPYQLGGGYVLSYALSAFVASNVDILRYYRSEDVSVGVWFAGVQVKYVHDPRFDTEWTSRGCNNHYLVTHKHDRAQLERYATNIESTGELCDHEFQSRPSYVYNFAVPPSQCCTRVNGSNIP